MAELGKMKEDNKEKSKEKEGLNLTNDKQLLKEKEKKQENNEKKNEQDDDDDNEEYEEDENEEEDEDEEEEEEEKESEVVDNWEELVGDNNKKVQPIKKNEIKNTQEFKPQAQPNIDAKNPLPENKKTTVEQQQVQSKLEEQKPKKKLVLKATQDFVPKKTISTLPQGLTQQNPNQYMGFNPEFHQFQDQRQFPPQQFMQQPFNLLTNPNQQPPNYMNPMNPFPYGNPQFNQFGMQPPPFGFPPDFNNGNFPGLPGQGPYNPFQYMQQPPENLGRRNENQGFDQIVMKEETTEVTKKETKKKKIADPNKKKDPSKPKTYKRLIKPDSNPSSKKNDIINPEELDKIQIDKEKYIETDQKKKCS